MIHLTIPKRYIILNNSIAVKKNGENIFPKKTQNFLISENAYQRYDLIKSPLFFNLPHGKKKGGGI